MNRCEKSQPTMEQNHDERPIIVRSIQVLRGAAATAVVVHHATPFLAGASEFSFEQGASGVDVFFVISGFVIYITGSGLSWREFLGRRVARIVPLYWLFLTLKLGFALLDSGGAGRSIGGRSYLLASYLFVQPTGLARRTPRR